MSRTKNRIIPSTETPASRRRARTPVLVGGISDIGLQRALLKAAEEHNWNLIDLLVTRNTLPSDPLPNGVLYQCLSRSFRCELERVGCPYVEIVPSGYVWPSGWPVVASDILAHGRLAAEYFHGRGFERVAYVGNDPWADAQPLYHAFCKRAGALGISCHLLQVKSRESDERLSRSDLHVQREEQRIEWLQQVSKPIGVFTYSDINAARICMAAQKAGIAVPEDVAILGDGNNAYICEAAPVMLSSIDHDDDLLIQRAVELLQQLMAGGTEPEEPLMIPPGGIVERQSTDVLSVPDPNVVAAIRYMWAHLDLDLSVESITREVAVPRHRLERAFRKHLNCGINEELRRKRLEVFHELLTHTDRPISELARSSGFFTMVHLQRTFRGAYGVAPREYRKRWKKAN